MTDDGNDSKKTSRPQIKMKPAKKNSVLLFRLAFLCDPDQLSFLLNIKDDKDKMQDIEKLLTEYSKDELVQEIQHIHDYYLSDENFQFKIRYVEHYNKLLNICKSSNIISSEVEDLEMLRYDYDQFLPRYVINEPVLSNSSGWELEKSKTHNPVRLQKIKKLIQAEIDFKKVNFIMTIFKIYQTPFIFKEVEYKNKIDALKKVDDDEFLELLRLEFINKIIASNRRKPDDKLLTWLLRELSYLFMSFHYQGSFTENFAEQVMNFITKLEDSKFISPRFKKDYGLINYISKHPISEIDTVKKLTKRIHQSRKDLLKNIQQLKDDHFTDSLFFECFESRRLENILFSSISKSPFS